MKKDNFNRIMGNVLRKLREGKKLSQTEVAYKMDMEPPNLSKYERGLISPTYYWITRFCDSIGISIVDFSIEFKKTIEKHECK